MARIATGIAILGLATPAPAATTSTPTATTRAAQTSLVHRTYKHKKTAAAENVKSKKPAKKVEKDAAEVHRAPDAGPAR